MMARHRQQLTELLTRYGPIDMVCLDMWLGATGLAADARDDQGDSRKLQPNVMLRARGIGNYGDYYTPEGFVPGNPENTNMPWFVIYPLGRSFSYEVRPGAAQGRPLDYSQPDRRGGQGRRFHGRHRPRRQGTISSHRHREPAGSGRLAQDQWRGDLCHSPTRWRSVA